MVLCAATRLYPPPPPPPDHTVSKGDTVETQKGGDEAGRAALHASCPKRHLTVLGDNISAFLFLQMCQNVQSVHL